MTYQIQEIQLYKYQHNGKHKGTESWNKLILNISARRDRNYNMKMYNIAVWWYMTIKYHYLKHHSVENMKCPPQLTQDDKNTTLSTLFCNTKKV